MISPRLFCRSSLFCFLLVSLLLASGPSVAQTYTYNNVDYTTLEAAEAAMRAAREGEDEYDSFARESLEYNFSNISSGRSYYKTESKGAEGTPVGTFYRSMNQYVLDKEEAFSLRMDYYMDRFGAYNCQMPEVVSEDGVSEESGWSGYNHMLKGTPLFGVPYEKAYSKSYRLLITWMRHRWGPLNNSGFTVCGYQPSTGAEYGPKQSTHDDNTVVQFDLHQCPRGYRNNDAHNSSLSITDPCKSRKHTDTIEVACHCKANFIDGKCEEREPVYNAGTTQDPNTGALLQVSDPNNQGLHCGREIQGEDCEGSGEPIDVPWVGNPVSCATGQKKQTEALYQSPNGLLNFNLTYKKSSETTTRAYTLPIPADVEVIDVIKPEENNHGWLTDMPRLRDYGNGVVAFLNGRGITRLFLNGQAHRDAAGSLSTSGGNSVYTSAAGTAYHFDATGQVTQKVYRSGRTVAYSYPASNERVMTDDAGRSLSLVYDDLGPEGASVPVQMTDPAGQLYTYDYDVDGYLQRVNFPDGSYREYSYQIFDDGDKRLSRIQDETGTDYAFWAYDDQKRAVLSEHAGEAEKVTIVYGEEENGEVSRTVRRYRTPTDFSDVDYEFAVFNSSFKPLRKEVHACPNCAVGVTEYLYDSNGYLQEKTDAAGVVTRFTYNSDGLQTQKIEAWGTAEERTTATTWHTGLRKPLTVDEAHRLTTYTYDSNGNRLTRTVEDKQTNLERTTTWTYNSQGQVLTEDGPRTDVNDTVTYTYDAQGNLATVTNALGHTTTFANHDAHGNPLTITDANGVSTQLTYSARGWLTSATTAGKTTTYSYLANGKLASVEQPSGVTLHYEYDDAQRLVAIEDDAGNRMEYTLDLMGNRTHTEIRDASGTLKNSLTQVYNNLGQLHQTLRPGGGEEVYTYDAEGQPLTQEDALDRTHVSEYDPLGRLIKQIDPAQQETAFGYDAQDNLTSVTDPNGHTTTYTHNGFGEVTQLDSPDTGITTYGYDKAGNRTAQVDARGVRTDYSYDALNRLTEVHYPGDPSLDVTYTYDQGTHGIGRLTRIDDATGHTTYTYDAWGNITSQTQVTDGNTYTLGYSYNADNQLESITYPSGQVVAYGFDALGNISHVTTTDGGGTRDLATSIGYLPFGPANGWTLGNGLVVDRSFDQDYRLTGVTTTPVIDYSYAYDPAGNIVQWDNLLDTSRSQSFDYDDLDRLIEASGVYGELDYGYDPVGNRLDKTQTDSGTSTTDTYAYEPDSNRLTGITGGTTESMTYDAVGNIITRAGKTYTYNAANRLAGVEENSQPLASYQHNGKGERVIKTASGTTTHFVYDLMGNIIAEADSAGVIQREYVYLNGERLALIDTNTGSIYYYHNDHLSTPKALTDELGTVVWQADYTPFGELTETVSLVEQPFRFPGQYFDQETGLYYNYFRNYDPAIGRYVQSDPIGLGGGINTYGYAMGNPFSFIDPLGLEVVGKWLKHPSWSDISTSVSIGSISILEAYIASVNFSASAKLHFVIGCEDTCSGETWTLDSGERIISTSGSVDIPTPDYSGACLYMKKDKRAKMICSIIKLKKKADVVSRVAGNKVVQTATRNFNGIVKSIELATDPTLWCKTLSRN